MASKGTSRWAEDKDESADDIVRRRKEKEAKKRAREEKARKVEAQQVNSQPPIPPVVNGDVNRPSKRLKTNDETGRFAAGAKAAPDLLNFPTKRFGVCRKVEEYERLNEIEEGSYGLVSRAREKATGTVVALKKLKMDYANDGFPVTGLREIQTLLASRHPHIVRLREVVTGSTLKE